MRFRIYPPIAIARLGDDPDFLLGPEVPGVGPTEPGQDAATPATRFKDSTSTRIRKHGARFHLFQSDDGVRWMPAELPPSATVTWTVELTNKKSAITRPGSPPIAPQRPVVPPANDALVIRGGSREISGASAESTPMTGRYRTTGSGGTPYEVDVELGRLRTDEQGRLIVLGGSGFSSGPPGVSVGGSFYRNPRWHDDVADGPVTARVRLSPDAEPIEAEGGAWVTVGPPDYAPGVQSVVTLYDVLRQLGINSFGLPSPGRPSFDIDIAPLITRTRRLRWVHADPAWSSPELDDPDLRSPDPAKRVLRQTVLNLISHVEDVFAGHIAPGGPPYRLRAFQRQLLDRWANGDFDPTPVTPETGFTAAGLTRAALDAAAGQGFCPGIEAGIIMLDPTLYLTPFEYRLDHAALRAGDLTALMAQPWQADFLKCHTEWWPSQRPDLAPQEDGSTPEWVRGVSSHLQLVQRAGRLGVIAQQGAKELFVEIERDPALPG